MISRDEVGALRDELRRLEAEVGAAKQRLTRLEAELVRQAFVASGPGSAVTPAPREWERGPEGGGTEEPPPLPVAVAWAREGAASRGAEDERRGPGVVREWLERLQLWPPHGEGSAEARLGAWWATRIGMVLAVAGVVFFGVYVSQGTPPWVKLAQLVAASVGVALAGGWLERRWAGFGQVVTGGGLALIYFSAFAAHAVPAVQVLSSPAAGAAWQLGAVALVLAVAWRRGVEAWATMAVLLGYAAIGFSFVHGLPARALIAAWLLAAVAAGLRVGRGWRWPLWLAVAPVYAVQGALSETVWRAAPEVLGGPWLWLAATYGLLVTADWVASGRRGEGVSRDVRWRQGVQMGLAIVAGVAAAWGRRETLVMFYAAGGGVGLATAWLWARRELTAGGGLVTAALAKGTGLLALAAMTQFDSRTRWLVLLVQAWVWLEGSRRLGGRTMPVLATMVWAAASGFFLLDIGLAGPVWWSWEGGAAALFVLGSAGLAGRLEARAAGWGESSREVAMLAGLLAGVVAAGAAGGAEAPGGEAAAWAALLAAAVGVVAVSLRAAAAALAAGLALAVATGLAWLAPVEDGGRLVLGVGAVLAVWLGAGVGWWRLGDRPGAAAARMGAHLVLAVPVGLAVWSVAKGVSPEQAIAVAAALAVAAVGVAPRLARWPVVAWSALPVPLAYAATVTDGWMGGGGDGWLGVAAALAWAAPAGVPATGRRALVGPGTVGGLVVLATAVTVHACLRMDQTGVVIAFTGALAGVVALAKWARLEAAWPATTWLAGAAALAGMVVQPWSQAGWAGHFAAVAALAAVMVAGPVGARRWAGDPRGAWRGGAMWGHATLALGLVFVVAIDGPGAWAEYATVVWGAAAVGVFVAGLFAAERALRLTGLLGIAVAVARVLVVDLDSALGRIVAFVAVGLGLLWVGFSYQRFRHLIADEPREGGKG